jgi:hypothetical protein
MTRKRESSTEGWVEGLRREREEREESLMTTVEKRGRGRPKKVVHRGLHKWRYKDNPLEKRFADEWAKLNADDRGGLPTLLYLLAEDNNRPVLEEMSARDAEVAYGRAQPLNDRSRFVLARGDAGEGRLRNEEEGFS